MASLESEGPFLSGQESIFFAPSVLFSISFLQIYIQGRHGGLGMFRIDIFGLKEIS